MRAHGYEWINHSLAPTELASHDFRVTIGNSGSACTQPYSASVFSISATSFGALSSRADSFAVAPSTIGEMTPKALASV